MEDKRFGNGSTGIRRFVAYDRVIIVNECKD
jgi:hypothetical protein